MPEIELITFDDEPVFVFGSNELGQHGGGAAKAARDKFGAIYGQGFGPQGNTFGIPTCSKPTGQPNSEIDLEKIAYYVDCFLLWARKYRPNQQFKLLRYEAGEVSVLEVVDAQNTLTLARNAYDDGLVRYRVALSDLQTLTGSF